MTIISNLAKQAGFTVDENYVFVEDNSGNFNTCPEARKLAQLVVLECIKSIEKQANESAYGYAMRDTLQGIAETFGMNWNKYNYRYEFDNAQVK